MITIMSKKYYSPMLQIVGINKNDIIVTSLQRGSGSATSGDCDAPGLRGLDDWYEGY